MEVSATVPSLLVRRFLEHRPPATRLVLPRQRKYQQQNRHAESRRRRRPRLRSLSHGPSDPLPSPPAANASSALLLNRKGFCRIRIQSQQSTLVRFTNRSENLKMVGIPLFPPHFSAQGANPPPFFCCGGVGSYHLPPVSEVQDAGRWFCLANPPFQTLGVASCFVATNGVPTCVA